MVRSRTTALFRNNRRLPLTVRRKCEPGQRTQLYRHFGAEGELLYVGISKSAAARLAQHHRTAHWFDGITNVTIEHFPSRQAALEAERRAIREERPLFNKSGVDREPAPFFPAWANRSFVECGVPVIAGEFKDEEGDPFSVCFSNGRTLSIFANTIERPHVEIPAHVLFELDDRMDEAMEWYDRWDDAPQVRRDRITSELSERPEHNPLFEGHIPAPRT